MSEVYFRHTPMTKTPLTAYTAINGLLRAASDIGLEQKFKHCRSAFGAFTLRFE